MTHASLPPWRDDWALFLDVDGTLLEIAATPSAVSVPQRAIDLLSRLHDTLAGALALVSGRPIADLDRLFAPLRLPVAGAHGAERRDAAGLLHSRDYGAALAPARNVLARWAAAHPGVLLEDKGVALALHYRRAPELEAAARDLMAAALVAVGPAFRLQDGKKVVEIAVETASKGLAIAQFMAEAPFVGRLPVFVGDDLTDEDGFAMVNRLGGHSVAVGVNRATKARWHLHGDQQVLAWLEANAGGAIP
jgi:trehalose 6-phosphate phosphatase